MATLAEIRAKLQESQNRTSGTSNNSNTDKTVYPHWNLTDGKECVLRFLPDGNVNNSFFWVERQMIRLPFAGVVGSNDNREVIVQVPCVEMYNNGQQCPILNEVRTWFKDPSLEEMGRKYWKKRNYIFQAFVVEDGLGEDSPPENPIRRLTISPQIFQIIRSALLDPELEEVPTHYVHGLDFRVVRTSKGGFADWSTSKWSRRERALSDAETAAIETYGLPNLAEHLPKQPTAEELRIIKEMFEASVNGEPYDPERWGAYYRPAGVSIPGLGAAARAAAAQNNSAPQPAGGVVTPSSFAAANKPAAVEADDDEYADEPVVTSPAAAPSSSRAHDILAAIRNRKTQ